MSLNDLMDSSPTMSSSRIKNGPLDFQPREPFTPLFGAMPETALALELQITKEYLGHSTSSAYLGPMWEEILQSETYAKGIGSTVARIVDGSHDRHPQSCIAGVANIGDTPNWCGSIFNQANWYAFGRLAWNPDLSAEQIAEEWTGMTFCSDSQTHETIRKMMMGSYEACVDYTMPLGLNFSLQRRLTLRSGPGQAPKLSRRRPHRPRHQPLRVRLKLCRPICAGAAVRF